MATRIPSRRTHTIVVPDTEAFEALMAELLYAGYISWLTDQRGDCWRPSLPCPGEGGPCPTHGAAKQRRLQPFPLRAAMAWPEWKRALIPALRAFWERYTEQDWLHPTKRNAQDHVHAMIEQVLAAYDPAQRPRLSQKA